MMAAYREDAESFNANQALADLHFEQATERTELGRKCLTGANVWDKSNNHKLSETDQEALWRATARHAYVALKANPNDVNCMNYMAQAKFAIGIYRRRRNTHCKRWPRNHEPNLRTRKEPPKT